MESRHTDQLPCSIRLSARTPGFRPGKSGSIPLSSTKNIASSGGIPDLWLRTTEEPFDSVRGCQELLTSMVILSAVWPGLQATIGCQGESSVAKAPCWLVAQTVERVQTSLASVLLREFPWIVSARDTSVLLRPRSPVRVRSSQPNFWRA